MLKLPRNREIEIELGTGELEIVASPGRYTNVDRASLGRPRTRAGQSSAPPPAHRSAPPPAFRSAPPAAPHGQQAQQAFQQQQQQSFRPHAPHAFAQPQAHPQAHPSHYAPQAHPSHYAPQAHPSHYAPQAHPSYAPPPPVPWTPAYASAQNSGPFPSIPAAPGSLAAVADPTSQHFAIVSASASRKGGASGLVWAATLIVMGAFLGAMYGVYMRSPATTASAASVAASPIQPAPLQTAAVPVPAQPAGTPTAAHLSPAPHPAGSLVGVVGPASPVVIPGKPVEEPVASNGKGHVKHGAHAKHDVASAPEPSGSKRGSGSVAAALPAGKPKPTPQPAAPVTKTSGKTADEIAAQKMIDDLKAQRTL